MPVVRPLCARVLAILTMLGGLADLASPVVAARPTAPGRRARRGPAGPGRPAHRACASRQPGGRASTGMGNRHLHEPGLGERGRRRGRLPGRPAAADGSLPAVGGLGHRPHHGPRAPGRQPVAAGPPGRGRLRVRGRVVGAAGTGAPDAAAGPGAGRRGLAPDEHRRCRGPPGLRRRPRVPAVLRDHGRRRRRVRQGPRPRGAQQRPAVPLLPLVALPGSGRRGDRVLPEAVDRARGAGVGAGGRRRHPHPPAARRHRGRPGPAGPGVRAHRGELAGRRGGRAARRRDPPGDLAPGRRPASGRDRPPRPAPGQPHARRQRPTVADRLRVRHRRGAATAARR